MMPANTDTDQILSVYILLLCRSHYETVLIVISTIHPSTKRRTHASFV